MKLRFTLRLIGCTLLTLLTPSLLNAQSRGLDFGTSRQLRTCPSRTAPSSGRISVEQAKMYVACNYEERAIFNASVTFVDVLSLQIAPKPRRARNIDFRLHKIDLEKPVYDIRGSMIVYNCYNTLGSTSYSRGSNCSVYREPKSSGKCYQTTFGDWHCVMAGGSSVRPEHHMPAPE